MSPGVSRRLFAALLILTAIYRFSLLGHGATALVDETLYFTSVETLQSVAAGDLQGVTDSLAKARGRPGAALLQLPVAALQAIPSHYGVPASNLRSLLLVTSSNVIISIATLCFFYRVAAVVCADEGAALISAVVYALMVNTNLYLRHLVPYDLALCAGMAAIWLAVTRRPTAWLAMCVGLLAGALPAIYAGYYLLSAVVGAVAVGLAWRQDGARAALRTAVVSAAGVVIMLAAFEGLFRAGGVSFIGISRTLGQTITLGSFEEGWTFLPEYLVRVEGPAGVLLLVGAAVYLCRTAVRLRSGARPIDWLVLPAVAAWMAQAVLSAHLHRIVLYGRLIHPWMPFLAWMLADSLSALGHAQARKIASIAVVVAALIGWGMSAREFLALRYGPDVLYEMGIDTAQLPADRVLCELVPGTSFASPSPLNRVTNAPYGADGGHVLLNFCQALPTVPRPKQPATIPPGAALLFDSPHWMSYPAYAYEGLTPVDREAIQRDGYRMQVFRTSR